MLTGLGLVAEGLRREISRYLQNVFAGQRSLKYAIVAVTKMDVPGSMRLTLISDGALPAGEYGIVYPEGRKTRVGCGL